MSKNTLGYKFLKEMIDFRNQEPVRVADAISMFLNKHNIPHLLYDHRNNYEAVDGLLGDFFGIYDSFIIHLYPEVKNKTVLIGKGVCYDSGGYDIKPDMKDMFYDKNGALLAIAAGIDNKSPVLSFFVANFLNTKVVAGQIMYEKFTGLKVLIDDTDAEGRIGLAHCLGLAFVSGYTKVITIATLTGHAHMVTGDRTYAMVHSNRPIDLVKVLNKVVQSEYTLVEKDGELCADKEKPLALWVAPYHSEYDKAIDTKIKGADVRSCGSFKGAGTSTAFSFLKRFSGANHHIHVDIAAMMLDKNHNGYVWGIEEITFLFELMGESHD